MTLEELEGRLTGSEYREWAYYESLEPFGAVRDDWRAAFMLAVIANMVRGKNQKAFNPLDFAPESVHGWFRAIKEAERDTGDPTVGTTGGLVDTPTHPSMAIFDEMLIDHVQRGSQ